jgi:hypothetical protein
MCNSNSSSSSWHRWQPVDVLRATWQASIANILMWWETQQKESVLKTGVDLEASQRVFSKPGC